MNCLSATIAIICLSCSSLAQQIKLNGRLITDNGKPVPNTRVSVAGKQVGLTDTNGRFSIDLSRDMKEGERVIITVEKRGWLINYPLDGEWNLPNIGLQNIQTLDVIIVPSGSKALWTSARIEKLIANLSGAITKLKKERSQTKSVDFTYYLAEWAGKYGFTPQEVKEAFDEWAKAAEQSEDYKTIGLREFYKKNFTVAAANFEKAARKEEEKLNRLNEQVDRTVLSVYENWKLTGNAQSSDYKFRDAVESYSRAISFLSMAKYPNEWAEATILIGNAKEELGIRVEGEEGNRMLLEAVAACRQVLLVYTRKQSPQDWATAQNSLGIALSDRAERMEGQEGERLLSEAVAAYRQALEVRTREQMPQQWAATQNNLGTALSDQGERVEGQIGVQLLNEAVAAYRQALLVYTRKQLPQQWAAIQINLGTALLAQGTRIEGQAGVRLLSEAVAAYRRALLVYTREQLPQLWAAAQNNLGNALQEQGTRMEGQISIRLLGEAVIAYRQALLVYTREQLPQLWATTQTNLGAVLHEQAVRVEGQESARLLTEAVAAYRLALEVRTREQLPQDWADTQNNLGNVLQKQGTVIEGQEGAQLLSEAVAAYRQALLVYTREQLPQLWATTQTNLGAVLHEQAVRVEGQESARLLSEAITAYQQALLVYTREQLPQQWAKTQNNLGNALQEQGTRTTGQEGTRLLNEAVAIYQQALEVRTREQLPQQWAITQYNLGQALTSLKKLPEAAKCYANVLQVYPDNQQVYQQISVLYHEALFSFNQAFEFNRAWLQRHPNDLSALSDFAEKHFTTGRFNQCRQRISSLLYNKKLDTNSKIALRIIEIANLLALNQSSEVPYKIRMLIEAIASQPANFKLEWSFEGIKYFISHNEKLASHREWLQQLLTAVEGGNRDAIIAGVRAVSTKFTPNR